MRTRRPLNVYFSNLLACGVAMLLALLPARLAPAQVSPDDLKKDERSGDAALAERLAHIGQLTLSSRAIVPETLRQSAALFEAAMKLNPDEIRYPRLAAEAALQLGDTEGAIESYRAIKRIDEGDQVAQIRLTDLYVSRMETADQRLDYLSKLIGSGTIAAEVRAHAAYLAALIRIEKSERDEAIKELDEALRLSPLSPEALKKKWELAAPSMSPQERIEMLLTMLKSNPAQPGVMADIGIALASLGLSDLSLKWYSNGLELGQAVGAAFSRMTLTDTSLS